MRLLAANSVPFVRLLLLVALLVFLLECDTAVGADSLAAKSAKKKGFITIATIGSAPAAIAADTEPQKAVERMIAHWRAEFAQVLPDHPDLIVVPEACDRPGGFSDEKLRAYYGVRKDQVLDFFARTAK